MSLKGMIKKLITGALIVTMSVTGSAFASNKACTGHFVNPITDIDWDALFPLTIGDIDIVHSKLPDTDNPSLPVCLCKTHLIPRIGLTFGFWEPFAIADVTTHPFCMVNLGGLQLPIGHMDHETGGQTTSNRGYGNGAFYWVHWYKYPLVYWLELLTDIACMQTGDFGIAYFAEIDPTWNDDQAEFMLNPEAILFGNPVAQIACIADAVKEITGHSLPMNALFWCMGAQGSVYPLDGNILLQTSPIQGSLLDAERTDFKLHRFGLIWDSSGKKESDTCSPHYSPIMPTNRYRYQMVNPTVASNSTYPFGTSTTIWGSDHNPPSSHDNFGYMIWRKRNCCLF